MEPQSHPLSRSSEPARPFANTRQPALLLATAVLSIVVILLLGRFGVWCRLPLCGPLRADDIVQARLDAALPAPQSALKIEQTFVPRRNGLTEIELLLLRYENGEPLPDARFELTLLDDMGEIVATESLPVTGLNHNQPLTLTFDPQARSAGRRYTLRLGGSEDNPISAWGYSLDVYGEGQLAIVPGPLESAPATRARELRFATRYALTAGDALAAAARPLQHEGRLLAAVLLLPLPGVWLLLLARPRGWGLAWSGAGLALGVASWPLLWLWPSLLGWRWTGNTLWIAVAAGWAGAAALALRRSLSSNRRQAPLSPVARSLSVSRLWPEGLLLALIVLASLAARFIAVRDQAFPPWVDSSRHALITAVMVAGGRAPDGYAPYLPIEGFPYHFGFHTLSAGLALMTGHPLPDLLLTLGQVLNGLVPLAVYAGGRLATGRRAVGLLAAFLVALPFFFPGYYATWGRMTQIAAMVIMPVLLGLTWRLGRGWPSAWPLVSILAAGLFLVHFRVFLFFLPFAALAALVQTANGRARPLLQAGALAILLVLPQMARLLNDTDPLATISQSQPGYNDFPLGYVTTGWERLYIGLAAIAVVLVLGGVVRRRRWAAFPLLLTIWVGVLFSLLAGRRLGLPESLIVNLNSMYITLFLPLSLLLSIVAVALWQRLYRWLAPQRDLVPTAALAGLSILAGLALGLLALFGIRQQANILNPQTILALPEDTIALNWMAANLPDDAQVAVNAWQWLGTTWAGSDGGAWIVPLVSRQTTTPPVDHIYDAELFATVRAFNEAARNIDNWSDPAAARWLQSEGVTHVYAGQRGGPLDPAQLLLNPSVVLLFQNEGAFVFAVNPP